MHVEKRCPYVTKADPSSSHGVILACVQDLPAGTRILDVGAATGILGELLRGKGFALYGIEPSPRWAEAARKHYQELMCCSLEQAPDPFLSGYDVAICADVLEHMPDPRSALQRLTSLQPMGCKFIVSVPNVANLWVRLNLLLGRFPYAERGILDSTHLRFFTRDSLLAMVRSVGLKVGRTIATPIPLGLIYPSLPRTAWGRAVCAGVAFLTNLWPTLLGYQFIVQAVKSSPEGDAT